ncbi:MAG: DUF1254 domain-containing protein, partial [Deltaproteobacteria bacterium]|nr:DUF1254 domain-containing protein [Deltaproteobacteria bacterium]
MNKKLITLIITALLFAVGQAFAQNDTFSNEVDTHIGKLTFDHGIPTEETSDKLYYELDYHRAVQVYLWSLPIVG